MIRSLSTISFIALRLRIVQYVVVLGVVAVALATSLSSTVAQEAASGTGTPVASDSTASVSGGETGTTGENQVGGGAAASIGTPTSLPDDSSGDAGQTDSGNGTPPEGTPTGDPPANDLDSEGDVGTGAETGESDEATPAVEEEVEEPVTHELIVTVFNCATDPGPNNPAEQADCSVVEGAGVVATAGDTQLSSVATDASGQAAFSIEEGLTAVIAQDGATVTEGFAPAGDGTVEVVVTGPAVAQLVNVAVDVVEPAAEEGRFQVISGWCYSLGEPFTEFLDVIGPMARAASDDCGPLAGAEFTVTGGDLAEPLAIVTDGSGNWTGFLSAGDYSIARAGASTTFSIVAEQITAVVAVDHIAGPRGTLSVQRYTCTEGDVNGTVISVNAGGGVGPPNESCAGSAVSVQVYSPGSSAESLVLDLGSNGSTSVEMAAGDYVLRDINDVEQAFALNEGESVQILIVETRLTGVVAAQINLCADPASNFENAGHPAYWSVNCGPAAAGIGVSLIDGNGNVIASTVTGGGGSVSFEDILAGVYRLRFNGLCALFANGADARSGFAVGPHQVVQVASYECAKPPHQNPPGNGGNNGGGNQTGGNQTGGNPNGNPPGSVGSLPDELFSIGDTSPRLETSTLPELYVTRLPATGADQSPSRDLLPSLLLVMASAAFAAVPIGLRLAPARRRS